MFLCKNLVLFSLFIIVQKFFNKPGSKMLTRGIIAFDDLKTDYKNPVDMCNSLNPLVLPEYGIHLFLTLVFLVGGQWSAVVFNIPLLAYHIHRYSNRPMMSTAGLYDPTEVMNANEMWRCQKEGWIKLAFYLISFFYYLYRMMYALLV